MTPDQKFYFANAATQIGHTSGLGFAPTSYHLDEIRDRYPELRWLVDGYQDQAAAMEEMVPAEALTDMRDERDSLDFRLDEAKTLADRARAILHNLLIEEQTIQIVIKALSASALDRTAQRVQLETLLADLQDVKRELDSIED